MHTIPIELIPAETVPDLKANFCPSPWLHMRISNSGQFKYCRWAQDPTTHHIESITPTEYFQQTMAPIRQEFLNGHQPSGCQSCKLMEKHKKVSGRQRQLLKVGVRLEEFEKTLLSSPWTSTFPDSDCTQMPQDWQIDLGNYCNSACVFCSPESSSRIATEWKRIGLIDQLPMPNWTDNPVLVDKFVQALTASPHIQYLHFIGGETLITPAFKTILKALVQAGLNRTATIGFTTNLITWDDEVVELLTQFSNVNLGMSVESFSDINDYVRWPSNITTVHKTLDKWIDIATRYNWLTQFRTTPTILTIGDLLNVYDYAWNHGIAVESCNFLNRPDYLRPTVLPMPARQLIIEQMEYWISSRDTKVATIANTRDPNVAHQQIVQDLQSYVAYLKNAPDESHRLPALVEFLKTLETSRGNSILTYLPEYEELFRAAGY
jgi:sulfatase maturation enzyme AslB (radical SAM superfamily)